MVERRPVRLSSNLTRTDPPVAASARVSSSNDGCLAIAVIIGLVIAVVKCSSSTTGSDPVSPAAEVVGNAQQALVSAVSEQTPPPMQTLSSAGVRRGAGRVSIAAREDLAGEMIYSQNCYDVVGRHFSWRKLDECGGFDAEASLSIGDDELVGAEKEVAWFDGEAVAGRYLKAAVAAGLDADAADRRLSHLQSQVGARHRSKVAPAPERIEPPGDATDEPAPAVGEDNVTGAA